MEKEIDGVAHNVRTANNTHQSQVRGFASTNGKMTALKHFIVDRIAPEVDIRPEFLID